MIGIDTAYDTLDLDLNTEKQNGVDLFLFKSSQGNYTIDSQWPTRIKDATATDTKFIAYHYDDPMIPAASQLKWFVDHGCHKAEGLQVIELDCEDATDYKGNVLPAANMTAHIIDLWNQFSTLGLPLVFYSRKSWVDQYCPTLWAFLKGKPLHMAGYPELRTWAEQLLHRKGLAVTWDDMKQRIAKLGKYPWLPDQNVVLWQVTGDTFVLQGSRETMDIDSSPYTIDQFWAKLGCPIQSVPSVPAGSVQCPKCGTIFKP